LEEIAMLRVAALALFLSCIGSTALACGDEPSSQELTAAPADSELGDAYALALEASAHQELLERAQQLWEEFRQANCELMSAREAGPSSEAAAQCQAFMARERTFELRLLGY
jgi:uncharacterized protein YecT (DUF1311 family)